MEYVARFTTFQQQKADVELEETKDAPILMMKTQEMDGVKRGVLPSQLRCLWALTPTSEFPKIYEDLPAVTNLSSSPPTTFALDPDEVILHHVVNLSSQRAQTNKAANCVFLTNKRIVKIEKSTTSNDNIFFLDNIEDVQHDRNYFRYDKLHCYFLDGTNDTIGVWNTQVCAFFVEQIRNEIASRVEKSIRSARTSEGKEIMHFFTNEHVAFAHQTMLTEKVKAQAGATKPLNCVIVTNHRLVTIENSVPFAQVGHAGIYLDNVRRVYVDRTAGGAIGGGLVAVEYYDDSAAPSDMASPGARADPRRRKATKRGSLIPANAEIKTLLLPCRGQRSEPLIAAIKAELKRKKDAKKDNDWRSISALWLFGVLAFELLFLPYYLAIAGKNLIWVAYSTVAHYLPVLSIVVFHVYYNDWGDRVSIVEAYMPLLLTLLNSINYLVRRYFDYCPQSKQETQEREQELARLQKRVYFMTPNLWLPSQEAVPLRWEYSVYLLASAVNAAVPCIYRASAGFSVIGTSWNEVVLSVIYIVVTGPMVMALFMDLDAGFEAFVNLKDDLELVADYTDPDRAGIRNLPNYLPLITSHNVSYWLQFRWITMKNSQDEPWHMILVGGIILFDLAVEVVVVLRIFLNSEVGVFELVATFDFLLTGTMIARICWKMKEANAVWKSEHLKMLSHARMRLSRELSERAEAQAQAVGIATGQTLTAPMGAMSAMSASSPTSAASSSSSGSNSSSPSSSPGLPKGRSLRAEYPPQEMLKIRLLFEALDIDHDGTVSKMELLKYYEARMKEPEYQKIQEIFSVADIDQSGALSLQEFARHAYPKLQRLEEPNQHLALVFDALDGNHNHTLDRNEVISFFERVTGAHPSMSVFAAIDANKDRKVSKPEFVRAMKQLLDREYRASSEQRQASDNQLHAMFQVLDSAIQEVQYNSPGTSVLGVEVDGQFVLQIFSAAVTGVLSGLTALFPVH